MPDFSTMPDSSWRTESIFWGAPKVGCAIQLPPFFVGGGGLEPGALAGEASQLPSTQYRVQNPKPPIGGTPKRETKRNTTIFGVFQEKTHPSVSILPFQLTEENHRAAETQFAPVWWCGFDWWRESLPIYPQQVPGSQLFVFFLGGVTRKKWDLQAP